MHFFSSNHCKLNFPDTCGTKLYNYSIAISAVVISLVYCACSACVTGAIYIWPNIDMFDNAKSPRVRNVIINYIILIKF